MKYNEAIKYSNALLDIRKLYFPLIYKPIVTSLHELGKIRKRQGKFDDAIQFYQEALDVYRTYNPFDYITIANMCVEEKNCERYVNIF